MNFDRLVAMLILKNISKLYAKSTVTKLIILKLKVCG